MEREGWGCRDTCHLCFNLPSPQWPALHGHWPPVWWWPGLTPLWGLQRGRRVSSALNVAHWQRGTRSDQIFRSSGALPAILMWQAGNLGCSHTRAGASVMNKALVRRNVSSSGPRTGQKHHRKTSETSPTHKPTHLGPFHGGHQHGAGDKRPETFHKSIQL